MATVTSSLNFHIHSHTHSFYVSIYSFQYFLIFKKKEKTIKQKILTHYRTILTKINEQMIRSFVLTVYKVYVICHGLSLSLSCRANISLYTNLASSLPLVQIKQQFIIFNWEKFNLESIAFGMCVDVLFCSNEQKPNRTKTKWVRF